MQGGSSNLLRDEVDGERKDGSRVGFSAHSKAPFCAYARASLRLKTLI